MSEKFDWCPHSTLLLGESIWTARIGPYAGALGRPKVPWVPS